MERGVISDPDMVVVMDETLLQDTRAKPLSGLRKNGVILINASRTPEEVTADHGVGVEAQVVTLDMTKMALTMLGESILSTPAGAAAVGRHGAGAGPGDRSDAGVDRRSAGRVAEFLAEWQHDYLCHPCG